MCGILGQISFKNSQLSNIEQFKRALDLQGHRGPDSSDVVVNDSYIFGHRRLSIIDLDSYANQPMISSCGNYIIVFNGEIYNYQEIRKDLLEKKYLFKTTSDTEVLLNAFIEYGIDCIEMFIGMFAFAVYDKGKDEFYIVRDRLGIKPLYYTNKDGVLIFSSEIKSILALTENDYQLNTEAISSYLSFRYPILGDTFFNGIHSLLPAQYIRIHKGEISIVEYWSLVDCFRQQKIDKGEAYYVEKIRELLTSAVKYRMISDVPIGAFLSGGVDSSAITALMAMNSKKPVNTFTVGFEYDGYSEACYAKVVADRYKTRHKEILLSGDDYINTMEKLIQYKDAPLSVPNEVPLYLMSKELKKDITVVLSGEGADEIFGGYGRIFRSPYDLERIKDIDNLNISDSEKRKLSRSFIKKYGVSSFQNEIEHFMSIYSYTSFEEKKSLLHDALDLEVIEEKFIDKFMTYFDEIETESYYNKIMYVFEKIHIVGLLHRVDTATMTTSVEARVPFVDHRLVEFACTIPVKYKLKWCDADSREKAKLMMSDEISEKYDTPKYILKRACEDILPHEILYRKKMGFPVPLNKWFGGDFNQYARNVLLSDEAKARQIYNIVNIEDWLNNDKLGVEHGFAMKIWMLINVELFIKNYFD